MAKSDRIKKCLCRNYSTSHMEVRQKGWVFTSLPTAQSRGQPYLFVLLGELKRSISIVVRSIPVLKQEKHSVRGELTWHTYP